MKIVFFGTPQFAVPSLKMLAHTKNIEILAVITQPDKAVGRKQTVTPSPVKKIALGLKLPILQPKDGKDLAKTLGNINADFFVVIAYGTIIPEKVLKMPKYGCVNIHASLLPGYRGASPIQESLLNGDKETGVSIMKIDRELDHGDIFLIKRVAINENDTLTSLSEKLAEISSLVLPLALQDILKGKLTPIHQDHKKATFCRKIEKGDGKINWQKKTAKEIKNMVKAYTPWPSVYTDFNGKKIKILETGMSDENIKPGEFILENGILKIGAAKGCIIPKTVQLEGKNPMDIKSFINGYQHLLKQ